MSHYRVMTELVSTRRTPSLRPWGCPECGSSLNRVVQTDQDEDGIRVRLRRCEACGTKWATEERPIEQSAFYGRCYNRNQAALARLHRLRKICRHCGASYQFGHFSYHVAQSTAPAHAEAYTSGRHKDLFGTRRYQREWATRKRARSA